MNTVPPSTSSPRWKWILFAALVIGLVVALRLFPIQTWLRQLLDWAAASGPIGVGLFVLTYVIATVLLLPASVLTLGAGAAFGLFWGSIYVSAASLSGATAAFLVSRYLARDFVRRRIESNPNFAAIDRAMARGGWRIVGLTRLSPLFPFTFLNYAFGLTRISIGEYVLASWIGMMPGTILYVYLGSLAQAAVGSRSRSPFEWGLYGLGLVATVAVSWWITRLARTELRKSIPG
jgi:uncharacterized membrane protein YdjX (TVP38/TMEM64 family)